MMNVLRKEHMLADLTVHISQVRKNINSLKKLVGDNPGMGQIPRELIEATYTSLDNMFDFMVEVLPTQGAMNNQMSNIYWRLDQLDKRFDAAPEKVSNPHHNLAILEEAINALEERIDYLEYNTKPTDRPKPYQPEKVDPDNLKDIYERLVRLEVSRENAYQGIQNMVKGQDKVFDELRRSIGQTDDRIDLLIARLDKVSDKCSNNIVTIQDALQDLAGELEI